MENSTAASVTLHRLSLSLMRCCEAVAGSSDDGGGSRPILCLFCPLAREDVGPNALDDGFTATVVCMSISGASPLGAWPLLLLGAFKVPRGMYRTHAGTSSCSLSPLSSSSSSSPPLSLSSSRCLFPVVVVGGGGGGGWHTSPPPSDGGASKGAMAAKRSSVVPCPCCIIFCGIRHQVNNPARNGYELVWGSG